MKIRRGVRELLYIRDEIVVGEAFVKAQMRTGLVWTGIDGTGR
jgi:hypothetical protein